MDPGTIESIKANIIAQLTSKVSDTESGLKAGLRPKDTINAGAFISAIRSLLSDDTIEVDPDKSAPLTYYRITAGP